MKITKEIKDKYIEYVCVYRARSGFKEISQIPNESTEGELRIKYSTKGGISAWLSEKLGINLLQLKNLEIDEEIKEKKAKIDKVYKKYSNKKTSSKEGIFKFDSFSEFLDWYEEKPIKCCYCGVEEEYLEKYFSENTFQYYRNEDDKARQRGQFLELERVVTAPKDKNVYSKENCALSCYICNNAKSDFISAKDFKPIAKGINIFWNKVIHEDKNLSDEELFNKKVEFPDTNIWEK